MRWRIIFLSTWCSLCFLSCDQTFCFSSLSESQAVIVGTKCKNAGCKTVGGSVGVSVKFHSATIQISFLYIGLFFFNQRLSLLLSLAKTFKMLHIAEWDLCSLLRLFPHITDFSSQIWLYGCAENVSVCNLKHLFKNVSWNKSDRYYPIKTELKLILSYLNTLKMDLSNPSHSKRSSDQSRNSDLSCPLYDELFNTAHFPQ